MVKKIDWSLTYKEPLHRTVDRSGKYTSGKDMLAKSFELAKKQEEIQAYSKSLMPAMQKLFEIRAMNGSPLKVLRPIHYQTTELVKSERGEGFVETVKTIHAGDEILLKSIDPNLQVYIFTNKKGEELEICYSDTEKLLTNSDIYEVCSSLYKK